MTESPLLILSNRVDEVTDHIYELLDAILWDAYSSEDEVLEIGREVATKIGRLYGYGEEE
jgi:hypothetical protein